MSSTVDLRTIFSGYWKAYGPGKEASLDTRPYWSDQSIEKGIIKAAVRSLCALTSDVAYAQTEVEEISAQFWVSRRVVAYGRIRATALGLRDSPSLATCEEIADRSREALCLCVLSRSEVKVWPLPNKPPVFGAAGILALYPDDLDALGRGLWSLAELVEYKLYRRLILDKPDPETQFDLRLVSDFRQTGAAGNGWKPQSLSEVINQLHEDRRSWVEHPLTDRVKRVLCGMRSCLLTGPSSSGKSILALECGQELGLGGRRVLYTNLGTAGVFSGGWLASVVAGGETLPSVLIADDLQSSPAAARYLLAVGNLFRRASADAPPVLLAISWPDFASEAVGWMEDCVPISVRPQQVAATILREYGSTIEKEELTELSAQFGNDLLILRKCLEHAKRTGKRPDISNVAQDLWVSRTAGFQGSRDTPKRVALVAGSLGRFDIFTPRLFLQEESQVAARDLSGLERTGLIRRFGESYTLGHRSLCVLLTDWLTRQGGWQSFSQGNGPANVTAVVLDYLRSHSSALAVDTLRALQAKVGFKETTQLNKRAASVVEIWKALDSVVERIEHQQMADPTWGQTPSSAMFVVQALCEVGKREAAQGSLRFLREHWNLQKNSVEVDATGLSTESDFEKIRERMEEEDKMLESGGSPLPWPSASEVDFERFHKTWLAGVFLCAEAAAAVSPDGLEALARAIEGMCLPNGGFYPERVPWSTARVLIGLGACGHTVDTNPIVSHAADWLLRDRKEQGGCDSGIWRSGTGTWNSDLETTAMVLLALSMAGIDHTDLRLTKARAYLSSQRARWTAPSHELDGALSLQAYLAIGGNWEDVVEEAQHLSRWALGESLWRSTAVSPEQLFKQSCSVAQIASHLVSIAWTAVRSDLPAFLDALASSSVIRGPTMTFQKEVPQTDADLKTQVADVARKDVDEVLKNLLRSFSALSLGECTVVGNYRRYDERVRNTLKDWEKRISRPLRTSTGVHENFLIWAASGTGKSYFVKEIARSLQSEISFVRIDFARDSHAAISQALLGLEGNGTPTLCLVDEIDARAEETWPYEELFPLLDLNSSRARRNVFVLVGSLPSGLEGLKRHMLGRHKGADLLERIPVSRRFEIPSLSIEDKIAIVAGTVFDASYSRNQAVRQIERFALYFVLKNEELRSPRQLVDFVTDAVQRMSVDEDRLRYEDLFQAGDKRTYEFWANNQILAQEFSDIYVRIDA